MAGHTLQPLKSGNRWPSQSCSTEEMPNTLAAAAHTWPLPQRSWHSQCRLHGSSLHRPIGDLCQEAHLFP